MAMEKVTIIHGAAAPLPRDNIDTDTISPGTSRTGPAKTEFGERGSGAASADLFADWRYDAHGTEIADFVLNRPAFRQARILLAGKNFGCGSSREAAVWMLAAFGIRCVVAESFAEIFTGNCYANGLLPLVLPGDTIRDLAQQAAEGAAVTVDLTENRVTMPDGRVVGFGLPEFRRRGLLEGLDEIAVTLAGRERIEGFVESGRGVFPWVYGVGR